ncbi:hypothetical protein K3495_g12407 [Podosphaera aphanis]|nr:hypothetical protein K3495_g12407 [Podosphaera aphanis]
MFSQSDLLQLKSCLSAGARVVVPSDDDYLACTMRWSATAQKPAAIIVLPSSAADISHALKFTHQHQLDLAVKCSGHWFFSSTNGGLCIDLSQMNSVEVDQEKLTIRAAGGALWRDVYKAGEAHGLACVGGTLDNLGVGGLTLGGGYGFMSGARGLVIDNLLEIEYVLADGSLVTASARENTDLFWAARGAGASFGVATSFLFRAYEQKDLVWGGLLKFSSESLSAVVEAGNSFIDTKDESGSMVVSIITPPQTNSAVIQALVYYNGTEDKARRAFAPLLKLNCLTNETGLMTYPEINKILSIGPDANGMRHSMKGSAFAFPLSKKLAASMLDELSSFVEQIPDAASSMVTFEFCPSSKISAVAQTATSFANRGAHGNISTIASWTNSTNDEKCHDMVRRISMKAKSEFEAVTQKLSGEENKAVGEYFNYDGFGSSGQDLFGVNFPRLVEIKKRYDPENMFSKGPRLLQSSRAVESKNTAKSSKLTGPEVSEQETFIVNFSRLVDASRS